MADLQKYFRSFHNSIKLEYDDNQELRNKRDELVDFLKKNLPDEAGTFETCHQGSYAMYTGVKPIDNGDYDIDIGLLFDISKDDYPNPIKVKKWVYETLSNEYQDIEMKKPCVTVKFETDDINERNYHVDFAVLAAKNTDGKNYLARGKLNSDSDNRCWEESDPEQLVSDIKCFPSDSKDREQFRRVIRFLKRWKDNKFKGQVNRPSGIGLTVAGLKHFHARYSINAFDNTRVYKDIEALEYFVQSMINSFVQVINDDLKWEDRLRVDLPTPPYNDIYGKMTGSQMKNFKEKLQYLMDTLSKAKNETDPVEACKLLKGEFGDDFPVPQESATAQKRGQSFIVDNSSA